MRNDALAFVAGALSAAGLAVAILTSHPEGHPEGHPARAALPTASTPAVAVRAAAVTAPRSQVPSEGHSLLELGRTLASTVERAIEFAAKHAAPAPPALGDAVKVKANAATEADELPTGT